MKNILQCLENSAFLYPGKKAFGDEEKSLTYRESVEKAKSMGSFLLHQDISKDPVMVIMEKKSDALCAFFGVNYSGRSYVVIDEDMPLERIQKIYETLLASCIISDERNYEKSLKIATGVQVFLSSEGFKYKKDDSMLSLVRSKMIDTDPVYILFTSGSTGVPRGVVVSHRSVLSYAHWVEETFAIDPYTVFGNQTPFYFSMSVLDIFTSIIAGATLEIIPKRLFSFPVKLLEYINEKKINTIYWVPSALSIVANWKALDYVEVPSIKKVLFAGEVMPVKQLNYWIDKMPSVFYANLYGPTEVTDICAYYVVDRRFEDSDNLPIGRACDNCGLIVLKDDDKEANPGEEGELCVRGSFLAHGYYNSPQKTSESFVLNPLNKAYAEFIYRTGDIVKYNEQGELLYLTRKDFQVKRMGYRIELGEIESTANACEGVRSCACIYDMRKDELVLIYEGTTKKEAIEVYLNEKLLKYMRPSKIIRLKQMPHNQNGKIDRKYLTDNYENL